MSVTVLFRAMSSPLRRSRRQSGKSSGVEWSKGCLEDPQIAHDARGASYVMNPPATDGARAKPFLKPVAGLPADPRVNAYPETPRAFPTARGAPGVPATLARRSTLITELLVWWPLLLMVVTAVSGAFISPSRSAAYEINPSDVAASMLLSPVLLAVFATTAAALVWACSKSYMQDRSSILDRFCTVWHLTNATWYLLALGYWLKVRSAGCSLLALHCCLQCPAVSNDSECFGFRWSGGCDVLSGYFAVMPVIRDHYNTIDTKHLDPSRRSGLDAVYLTELCLHVPLCACCFVAFVLRWPRKELLEMFVCGIQVVGTIAYYLPEFLDGCANYPDGGIGLWLGVGLGVVWIIVPFALLAHRLFN